MIKRVVYRSARWDQRTAVALISSHVALVQSTLDSQQAFEAFVEKRPAAFEGR